jgi:PAS domain S-box-containing protein
MGPEESGAGAPAARGGDATVALRGERDRTPLDRYRAVFFQSPQPMMTYDAATLALIDANDAAVRQYGYARDDLMKMTAADLWPAEGSERARIVLSGPVPRPATVETHRQSGGGLRLVRTSVCGLSSGPRERLLLLDDATDRHEELALARARDTAEAANRELESFSYSVAHDLRAPLRGMSGFAQLLVDTYADSFGAEGRDWLQEIILNARKMGALIDALLSLARVARRELRYETVDLSAVVRATTKQLSSTEPGRHVEWLVEDGLTAELDAGLAQALVENLVGNAWKFTRGAAAARIEFGALELAGTRTFFVRDNGAGFDMAMSRRLFGPFQRLHSEHEFPGTGIGLATVQRIVHRHGGRVWAEAAVNAGATFYFTLPARASVAA